MKSDELDAYTSMLQRADIKYVIMGTPADESGRYRYRVIAGGVTADFGNNAELLDLFGD